MLFKQFIEGNMCDVLLIGGTFMKRSFLLCLIFLLSITTLAEEPINLVSMLEGGKVLSSDPLKDELALNSIIDGVLGTGGLLFTVSKDKPSKIFLELGGNDLNKIEQVVLTVQVPQKPGGKPCEVKILTSTKEEGPFTEAGLIRLSYSGSLSTVFEAKEAKYVILEFICHSDTAENIVVEEAEIYGVPILEKTVEKERVVTKDKISLFEHLSMEITWDVTDFRIVSPRPYSIVDGYSKIDVKTSDISISFNVDGRLSGRSNIAGQLTTPEGWERLFLPETVYVRCYFQQDNREWLVGSKAVIFDDLSNQINLSLSLGKNRSWPRGKYRVELFVANEMPISQYFWIEEVKEHVDSAVVSSGGSQ